MTPEESAALAKIADNENAEAVVKATEEISLVIDQCNMAALRELPALTRAVRLAVGRSMLRRVLNEQMMTYFMALQGTPVGFLTDRDKPPRNMPEEELKRWKPGYSIETVRECIIDGLLHGLFPVNNEINIVSDRMYGAKNGFKRLVLEWPGLTDFRMTNQVPKVVGETEAYVALRATWKLNGVPDRLIREVGKGDDGEMIDERFVIKVNRGMGADAIIGKAERKAYKAIHDILAGGKMTIPDGEIGDRAIDVTGHDVSPAALPPVTQEEPKEGKRMSIRGNARHRESSPKSDSNGDV